MKCFFLIRMRYSREATFLERLFLGGIVGTEDREIHYAIKTEICLRHKNNNFPLYLGKT